MANIEKAIPALSSLLRDYPRTSESCPLPDLRKHRAFETGDTGSLALVICCFNPCGYRSRAQNLARVLDWAAESAVPLFAAELRYEAEAEAPSLLPGSHPRVIQLLTSSVFWQKENLWNLVVRHLPRRYEKVICLDADVILTQRGWAATVSDALDSANLVHPFSRAIWVDATDEPLSERVSSGYAITNSLPTPEDPRLYHPGFGIAARRDLWAAVGGLYNAPIGNGDWMLFSAALNSMEALRPSVEGMSSSFWDHYARWASKFCDWVHGSIGCIPSDAIHLWHGSKKDRHYLQRVHRLKGYDPFTDITVDPTTSLPAWSLFATEHKREMVSSVKAYFALRNEDDTSD